MCWSQLTGGGQFLSSVSLSPDGALFDEAGENTEIIGGGDGDQSDCGGLSTRPQPELGTFPAVDISVSSGSS